MKDKETETLKLCSDRIESLRREGWIAMPHSNTFVSRDGTEVAVVLNNGHYFRGERGDITRPATLEDRALDLLERLATETQGLRLHYKRQDETTPPLIEELARALLREAGRVK